MKLPESIRAVLFQLSLATVVFLLGLCVCEWLIPGSVLPFFDVYQWMPLLWMMILLAVLTSFPRNRSWISAVLVLVLPFLYLVRWTFEDIGSRWMLGTAWGLLLLGFCFSLGSVVFDPSMETPPS